MHPTYLEYVLSSLAWSLIGIYIGLIAGTAVDRRWRSGGTLR